MKRSLALPMGILTVLTILLFAFTVPGKHVSPIGRIAGSTPWDGRMAPLAGRSASFAPLAGPTASFIPLAGKKMAFTLPAGTKAAKSRYPQYYAFAYEASNGTPPATNIYVYCYLATQVPSGTTYDLVNCPQDVDITVLQGPATGDEFTFPSGQSEYIIYNVPVTVPNPQPHYDISTNPLGMNGLAILSAILPIDSV